MSNTARPKSAGNKLSADEINQDLPIQGTAGETINGATLPVPVYVYATDGELYACDANDTAKLDFIGFVINNTTDGNAATLQKDGVVSGFTGLTIGSRYYVQDAVGTIGISEGLYKVLVGIAVSATELLIVKDDLEHLSATIAASDNLIASADTERSHDTGTYTMKKEIQVKYAGTIRVKFDGKSTGNIGYLRIYKNGSAVGTERQTVADAAYETFSEDITVAANDLIQLYLKNNLSLVYCRNFRVYYTKSFTRTATYAINTN